MTDLFPDAPPKPLLIHGDERKRGTVFERNFHGFYQYRETRRCRWRFVIEAFGCDDSTAEVLRMKPDGQSVTCSTIPIDAKDRLLIEGRRYGRDHWKH